MFSAPTAAVVALVESTFPNCEVETSISPSSQQGEWAAGGIISLMQSHPGGSSV